MKLENIKVNGVSPEIERVGSEFSLNLKEIKLSHLTNEIRVTFSGYDLLDTLVSLITIFDNIRDRKKVELFFDIIPFCLFDGRDGKSNIYRAIYNTLGLGEFKHIHIQDLPSNTLGYMESIQDFYPVLNWFDLGEEGVFIYGSNQLKKKYHNTISKLPKFPKNYIVLNGDNIIESNMKKGLASPNTFKIKDPTKRKALIFNDFPFKDESSYLPLYPQFDRHFFYIYSPTMIKSPTHWSYYEVNYDRKTN